MAKNDAIINNGKMGGNLVGKPHKNKSGEDVGGIKAIVTDANNQPVELEGGEVIINKAASKKYWKELSKINQSAGNGVAINQPIDPHDEDPLEYEQGGKIEFNTNKIPNKWILDYAEKIKSDHPELWKLGGNIFGNEAFLNLKRVSKRGYWLDDEKWMYIKWRSYVARHKSDFRIAGVIAMLKWVDKVDKGWVYMKQLIETEKQKSIKKGWQKKPPSFNLPTKVISPKVVTATKLAKGGAMPTRDGYSVGDGGFYNGKTRVPIEITAIKGKNVYFEDGSGKIKRSEKKNFDRLYEAVITKKQNIKKVSVKNLPTGVYIDTSQTTQSKDEILKMYSNQGYKAIGGGSLLSGYFKKYNKAHDIYIIVGKIPYPPSTGLSGDHLGDKEVAVQNYVPMEYADLVITSIDSVLKAPEPQPTIPLPIKVNDVKINYYDVMVSYLKENYEEVTVIPAVKIGEAILKRFTVVCKKNEICEGY